LIADAGVVPPPLGVGAEVAVAKVQVDIVDRLRAEADVLAADERQVLVVPVRQVGAFSRGWLQD
jgi:hypothetical protein